MRKTEVEFPGFDARIDSAAFTRTVSIPDRVFSIDLKCWVQVSLEDMRLRGDEGIERSIRLKAKLDNVLSKRTFVAAAAVLLDALDGKRKLSTTVRWLDELSLFLRTVSGRIDGKRISTITLKMFEWYARTKGPSQVKLLRSALKFWSGLGIPGLAVDLLAHLVHRPPPKPRGMIEVQNAEPSERPFSLMQVQCLLASIDGLYINNSFDPQANLLWRLIVSEAMRPAQMSLLRVGDVEVKRTSDHKVDSATAKVPMVKQAGTCGRDYMTEHRLSHPVAQALSDHLSFVEQVHGGPLPEHYALFCVRRSSGHSRPATVAEHSISIHTAINCTRQDIATEESLFEDTDLFCRRFKHTKLTHLAKLGASPEVLAHAGFQTSTVSLRRYVNLRDEDFELLEEQLAGTHALIDSAFRGTIIQREDASHPDPEHRISDPTMQDAVGSCGAVPCGVLACLGCYVCPRFEAFEDGPHELVEEHLMRQRDRAMSAGLPAETVSLRDHLLAATRTVIHLIKARS